MGTSFRFLVMKIEKNEVVLEKGVDKVDSATWYDDFCAEYLKDTPAYVAIDFDYKTTDGRDADKVILLGWIPDTAKSSRRCRTPARRRRSSRRSSEWPSTSTRPTSPRPASTPSQRPATRCERPACHVGERHFFACLLLLGKERRLITLAGNFG